MLRKDEKLLPAVAEGWVTEQKGGKILPSAAAGWGAEQHHHPHPDFLHLYNPHEFAHFSTQYASRHIEPSGKLMKTAFCLIPQAREAQVNASTRPNGLQNVFCTFSLRS